MARSALALVFTAALTSTGCFGLFADNMLQPGPTTVTDGLAPGLPIGPETTAQTPSTELPLRQASAACLTTAKEIDQRGSGVESMKQTVALYEKARSLDPSATEGVGRRLAVLYDLLGDFSKAQAEYKPLLKASPNDPKLLNDIGYSFYCRGDLLTAENYLRNAVQNDPNLKAAWLNLGLVVLADGRTDEGFTAFQKAGSEGEAHANLAFVLSAQGKTTEAKAEYRKAIALEPGLTSARSALDRLENPPKIDPTGW